MRSFTLGLRSFWTSTCTACTTRTTSTTAQLGDIELFPFELGESFELSLGQHFIDLRITFFIQFLHFFKTTTTAPQTNFAEIPVGKTNFPYGNYAWFTNLTSSTATINVTNYDGWSLGIHAVQIKTRS